MADLQRTPIWREVSRIIEDGVKPINHRWECYIHANGKNIKCLYTNGYTQSCRFTERYTDRITIMASLGEGTFQHDVVPYKENIEVTLIKKPLAATVLAKEVNEEIQTYRYRGFLTNTSSELLESNIPKAENKGTLDRIKIRTFELQLINKTVEQLRLKYIGNIHWDTTGISLIRKLLTEYSTGIGDDARSTINGVTVYDKASEIKKRQIVIPDGTPLIAGPDSAMHLINRQCGGVFMYGFKYYYMNNQWYVFAPFDTTQFEKRDKTVTIINVPNNRLTNIERTYRLTESQIIILATSTVKTMDVSNESQLNKGNGARFIDANKVMESMGDYDIESDSALIKGKDAVNEFILEERKDGLNNINIANNRITAGYYLEYAELTKRNGGMIQIKWENAKSGYIFPGMAAKFIYLVNDIPFEIYGSVVAVDYVDNPVTKTVTEQKFSTVAAITLFIASKIPKELKNQ